MLFVRMTVLMTGSVEVRVVVLVSGGGTDVSVSTVVSVEIALLVK